MYFFRDATKTKQDFVLPNKAYILYHVMFYFNNIHVSKIYLREYKNISAWREKTSTFKFFIFSLKAAESVLMTDFLGEFFNAQNKMPVYFSEIYFKTLR